MKLLKLVQTVAQIGLFFLSERVLSSIFHLEFYPTIYVVFLFLGIWVNQEIMLYLQWMIEGTPPPKEESSSSQVVIEKQGRLKRIFHLTGMIQSLVCSSLEGNFWGSFHPFARAIGFILFPLAILGALWSRFSLGKEWRGNPEIRSDHKLITRGAYRYIRHPIYSFLILLTFGNSLIAGHWLGLVSVIEIFVLYYYKGSVEEILLEKQFGVEYKNYKRRVSMLIPFIF